MTTTLTERAIELAVQRKFDRIDQWLMSGKVTQDTYDEMAREIDCWAAAQYSQRRTTA
jgi:hypothetical protein